MGKVDVMINFSCELDTLVKRELSNCLHQTSLWVCLWGIFLTAN